MKTCPPLTAYKITYSDGTEISINMAADVTLPDAVKYFVGQRFDVGSYPVENIQTATMVEEIEEGGDKCAAPHN